MIKFDRKNYNYRDSKKKPRRKFATLEQSKVDMRRDKKMLYISQATE